MNAFARSLVPGDGYVLPGALTPYPDESLPGLVMRNAEMFRFVDPMRIFRRLAPPKVTLWTFCQEPPVSPMGDAIRALLGLDDAAFARLSMWTGDDTSISVLGQPIWLELIRHTARAICPLCLREASYHRATWLVDALPICPVHGIWLHDRCPAPTCRKMIAWGGRSLHRCGHRECKYDLRNAPVEEAQPDDLGGIASLHRVLLSPATAPLGMPPGEAVKMAFILGQLAFGFDRAMRPPGFIRRERERMPAIINAGWRALDDWPNGFHNLLDGLRSRADERKGTDGLRKSFGTLSKRVYDWARTPWGAPIGVAFADYAARQTDLGTTSQTLARYAPGAELTQPHVSVSEAQGILGISPAAMRAIADRRDIFVLRPRGGGRPSLLRTDKVRELQEEMRDFLLPDEMRSLLGVGRRVWEQLEAADLVRRVPEAERVMESRPYRRSEIDAFVSSCVGDAELMTATAVKAAGFTTITRGTTSGRSVVDICRALISGRVKPAAIIAGERGLMRVRLCHADLQRVLPAERETMSMVEAAEVIGTHYRNLPIWARRGFLETVRAPRRGERGLRVTGEALDRFRADFIVGSELAALFGQEANHWLSRHLKFQGVLPVSGHGIDGSDMTLFRRAECTPEVIAAVRRVQAGGTASPQDKHRSAFARGTRVAATVAAKWCAVFQRINNRFIDADHGRTLQVVSGRRPDLTGVFRFGLQQKSLRRLRSSPEPWLALVPDDGDTFLLVPCDRVPWRGDNQDIAYLTLRFDVRGQPLEMAEWAVPLPAADEEN